MFNLLSKDKSDRNPSPPHVSAIRYWLIWGLWLLALAYGIHSYFEYRNAELDKRIEQLR